jgi:hypothetical protein
MARQPLLLLLLLLSSWPGPSHQALLGEDELNRMVLALSHHAEVHPRVNAPMLVLTTVSFSYRLTAINFILAAQRYEASPGARLRRTGSPSSPSPSLSLFSFFAILSSGGAGL